MNITLDKQLLVLTSFARDLNLDVFIYFLELYPIYVGPILCQFEIP